MYVIIGKHKLQNTIQCLQLANGKVTHHKQYASEQLHYLVEQ